MKIVQCINLILALLSLPTWAGEAQCQSEYERGRREMGAYAEMAGIVEGTIYGYTLIDSTHDFCLSGTPKEKVQAIAKAFMSETEVN
jgi:hypothetical protein